MRSALRTRQVYGALIAAIAVGTVIGMVALWPRGEAPRLEFIEGTAPSETFSAEVAQITPYTCSLVPDGECREAILRLNSGPDDGQSFEVDASFGASALEYEAGDSVRVIRIPPPSGSTDANVAPYAVVDFERKPQLLWLVLAFAALVIVFARVRGFLSLLGLGISLAIVLLFVVPAILRDSPPLAVALVGSMAVMLTTIPLAHGLGPKSLAAIAGTAFSLLIVVALAILLTDTAHLTGVASEEAATLAANNEAISFQGLLIAGMVIGSLGVLDDVTISQSSTVMALRGANPELGFGELFRRAIQVGRDHVSATVNTLVLAYVGSSLTVLLVFASGELGLLEAVNLEVIAAVIVATLVGSIGLICAVPITTALAALLAEDVPADELLAAADDHAH
ncbi:MAG: YibE/F family protein [Actinobacteria bacterium]|nr:YibE/F family protein [Actinomycetota bacterium]